MDHRATGTFSFTLSAEWDYVPNYNRESYLNNQYAIPLDERLVNILRPHRQLNGFIIGDGLRPVTERTFVRTWQRIGKTINLHDATPHVFRHTYLTIAASSGLDIKTLQAIAGHADIQMTMNCSVHKREEKIIEANDLISGSFTAL